MLNRTIIHDVSEQRLRGSADCSKFFIYSAKGRRFSEKAIGQTLTEAEKTGVMHTYYRGNKLLASFSIYFDKSDFFLPIRQVFFTRAPYSQLARDWLREQFWEHRKLLREKTSLYLLESERDMLDDLEAAGFFINSRITQGCPKRALSGLVQAYDPPLGLKHLALEVRTPRLSEVDAICKMQRAEFRRNPQFGWFVASKSFEDRFRKELQQELKDPKRRDTQLGVYSKRGKVLGYAGVYVSSTPFYGLGAGATITLHQSIQGKGVVKTLYRRNLEQLVKRRARIIRGGTSQPPMLKLNRIMGRKTHGYLMSNGEAFFPRKHFFQFEN